MTFRVRPKKHLFPLGQVVATPAALAVIEESELTISDLLERHAAGDWGVVADTDARANDEAVTAGEQLLSAYDVQGERVWIITERDRSVTTVLTPDDY